MRNEAVSVNMTSCSDSLTSSYADTCTEAMFFPELNFTTAHCVFRSQQSREQRRFLPEHALTPAWSRMCRIILPAQSLPDRATHQSITHTHREMQHATMAYKSRLSIATCFLCFCQKRTLCLCFLSLNHFVG